MTASNYPDLRDITSRKARTLGISTDIDIDFADRDAALIGLAATPAVQLQGADRVRHKTGVYFQNVQTHPFDGMAVWDYKEAGEHGFFKIDLLNNSIYRGVRNEEHLDELLAMEPDWSLLQDEAVIKQLAHISKHAFIIMRIQPQSIADLAVCIALIRPGKSHLVRASRREIEAEIWKPSVEGYTFKRSHAIAYATSIVVQLNLLTQSGRFL